MSLIFGLCALTAFACAWLTLSSYFKSRYRLLLWSGLCFVGMFINNVILIFDRIIFPVEIDLSTLRLTAALIALLPLLYGLIWEDE